MKFLKGAVVWFLQTMITALVFSVLTMFIWQTGPWYEIALWAVMPVMGLFSAYYAVRLGLNNYIAWIAPPLSVFFANYFVTGFTPSEPWPMLLSAFLAIVGAAAGLVRNNMKAKKD